MSTIEVHKIIGAILAALLLAVSVTVFGDMFFVSHQGHEAQTTQAAADATVADAGEEDVAGESTETTAEETTAEAPAQVILEGVTITVATPVKEAAPAETAALSEPAGASSLAARLAAADPGGGKKTAKKCLACHSFEAGGKAKIGPNLWAVVGAKTARNDTFKYSNALAGIGGVWGYEELDAYLTSPKNYAPGTKMAFPGIKDPASRAGVIAYLRSLSDSPPPLPDG